MCGGAWKLVKALSRCKGLLLVVVHGLSCFLYSSVGVQQASERLQGFLLDADSVGPFVAILSFYLLLNFIGHKTC